jgi:branched-chain amino acid transport system ATP-binding protein
MPLAEIQGVTKRFGGLAALKGVDLQLEKGEILGLIGPNGSGKTTLINCITGFYKPTSGKIIFQGKDITGMKNFQVCRSGIARTFQIPRPFLRLTVLQNVLVASHGQKDIAIRSIEQVGLRQMEDTLAKNLTTHQTRLIEVARALATRPTVLMIDEAMAGLNPTEMDEIISLLIKIREGGITLLWVEHVMRAIMKTADRIAVLHEGKKIAEGTPSEIAGSPQVVEAYLGEKYIE